LKRQIERLIRLQRAARLAHEIAQEELRQIDLRTLRLKSEQIELLEYLGTGGIAPRVATLKWGALKQLAVRANVLDAARRQAAHNADVAGRRVFEIGERLRLLRLRDGRLRAEAASDERVGLFLARPR
jgi:hypothetical protein